jgi:hypothetical protein
MAAEELIKIRIQANAEEFKIVSDIINKELGKLGKNFEVLEGSIKQSAAAMNQFQGASKKFNKGIMSISLILQDLPYGFRGIQNNIPALAQGLGVVYLAISAVTAAMTYFVLQGDKMSEGTKKVYESFKGFINGVASDVYSALKPAFTSIVQSLQELWGLFGTYIVDSFRSAWVTAISVLQDAGQILSQTLKAIVSLLKGDWTGLGEALVNILKRASNAIVDVFNHLMVVTGNVKAAIIGLFSKDLANVVISETLAAAKGFSKTFKFAFAETKKETVDLFSLFKSETKKAEIELTDFERTMKSLELQQRKLNVLFYEFRQMGELDFLEGQIKALSSAIDDLSGQTTDDAIRKLQQLVQLRGELLLRSVTAKAFMAEDPIVPIEEPMPDLKKSEAEFKAHQYFAELFFKGIKDKFDQVKKAAKESEDYLMKIGVGMMSALGPAIDMLIDKGASIGEVLSTAFEDITKKLIKVAIAAAVVVALLASFGIIDVSEIGKTFGKFVGAGMGLGKDLFEPTAKGGIFGGPSYRLVGEYPGAQSNPEVVAPLDKLKDMIGGSGGAGNGEFVLRGNDLVLAFQRSNSSLKLRRG